MKSCSLFQNILLFLSSQTCQLMNLGRSLHVVLIVLFFGNGPRYLAIQPTNRSATEEGKMNLYFQETRSSCHMEVVNLHSIMRWKGWILSFPCKACIQKAHRCPFSKACLRLGFFDGRGANRSDQLLELKGISRCLPRRLGWEACEAALDI